jgi:hypothetical protein
MRDPENRRSQVWRIRKVLPGRRGGAGHWLDFFFTKMTEHGFPGDTNCGASTSCRRLVAVLVFLLAILPGESGKVAIHSQDPATRALACRGEETSYGERFIQFLFLVMIISATVGAVRVYDRIKEACGGGGRIGQVAIVITRRSVGTQSQTTYTSVRGVLHPRFLVLPEYSHG